MIRFSVILSVVAVAVGLLIAGAVSATLILVYLAIGVAGLALLMLIAGVVIWGDAVFGAQARREAEVGEAVAAPGASPGRSSSRNRASDVRSGRGPLARRPASRRPVGVGPVVRRTAGRSTVGRSTGSGRAGSRSTTGARSKADRRSARGGPRPERGSDRAYPSGSGRAGGSTVGGGRGPVNGSRTEGSPAARATRRARVRPD